MLSDAAAMRSLSASITSEITSFWPGDLLCQGGVLLQHREDAVDQVVEDDVGWLAAH